MSMGSIDNEKLYAKTLIITVKDSNTNHCRTNKLFLTVEWQPVPTAIHKQELVVYLTDSDDPFFLYTSNLSEEDFCRMKQQQELLVDFISFPQKFIELLELCFQEENKTQPKYLLVLTMQAKLGAVAQLDVVETNPFKHLTHLSLKLIAASDSVVKQYFAVCFKKLKDEKEQLENKLSFVENDLKKQVSTCQENLSSKTLELEHLQKELTGELSSKETKYKEDLQQEREKLLKIHREDEERWETERREKDKNHRKQSQQLEARVTCLDSLNKELQEKGFRAENTIRELQSRLSSCEKEGTQLNDRYQKLNKQNNLLQSELEEKNLKLDKLMKEVKLLETEISKNFLATSQLNKELKTIMEEKKVLEGKVKSVQNLLGRKEMARKKLAVEIQKANDVVLKLQEQSRQTNNKLKTTGKTALEQEQLISQKETQIKKIHTRLSAVETELKEKEQQIKQLENRAIALGEKVKFTEEQMKNKENIIKYLNRQLTELHCSSSAADPASNVTDLTRRGNFAASRTAGAYSNCRSNKSLSSSTAAITTPVQENNKSSPNYGPTSADRLAYQLATYDLSASTLPKSQPFSNPPLDVRYLQKDYDLPVSAQQRKFQNVDSDSAKTVPQKM